jgi:ribonucleoside-diphosphate reductase beta chain
MITGEKTAKTVAPITVPRQTYKPFEYGWAQEYTHLQQRAFWLPAQVPMGKDIQDYTYNLNDAEKEIIRIILQTFAQTEIFVEDYWATVAQMFPKPEISGMAYTFAAMETIHAEAYAYLNESLGLDDWEEFAKSNEFKNKALFFNEVDLKSPLSLAIFSALVEGVALFSSFTTLMSFQLTNRMTGISTIVEWSARDESLHSKAGCHLFRQWRLELNNPLYEDEILTIYNAVWSIYKLELNTIAKMESVGKLNFDWDSLRNLLRYRIYSKIEELGIYEEFKSNLPYYANLEPFTYDKSRIKDFDWFEQLTSGKNHKDFFAATVTDYSKVTDSSWNNLDEL